MHIQPINNTTFGRIILQEDNTDGSASIYLAEPINDKVRKEYNNQWAADRLIDGVIDSDYDTLELRTRYNKLIDEQKNNPVDIIVDLFYSDVPAVDDFYQKAAVGGKVFKQRVGYWPGLEAKPTTIEFLEKACKYANRLANRQRGGEAIRKFCSFGKQ